MNRLMKFGWTLVVIGALSGIGYGVTRWVKSIQFDRNCDGHLKRAADATNIELAIQELTVAVNHLKRNGITKGYTSVWWNTPDEDIECYRSVISGLKRFFRKN